MASVRLHLSENAPALYVCCVLLALAIHAGALYGWKQEAAPLRALEAENSLTEVELFEAATQSSTEPPRDMPEEQSTQPAPPIEPPPSSPPPETVPPQQPPEIPSVEQLPPTPTPPQAPSPIPNPSPEPANTPPPSPIPPQPSARPTASAKTGTANNNVTSKSETAGKMLGKPVYKVPPIVKYPAESRAAGEQGTVVLRIRVNTEGKPVEVTVISSSGFSRLDRAAVEGGWRSRIDHAFEGAQFEAPLRFSLKN